MRRFRALVPVNRLDRAKGRLAEMLSPEQRAELALATLETVLDALEGAGGETFVLAADERVAEAVAGPATVLWERAGLEGLNPQLEQAVAEMGGDELLILHADLPLASAAALETLVAMAPAPPSITIAESGDGGTNAMLLRPPGRFALAYGRRSASLHRAAAEAAGMAVATPALPGLSLDLDTAADVAALLGSPEGRMSTAGKLLLEWHIAPRGSCKGE